MKRMLMFFACGWLTCRRGLIPAQAGPATSALAVSNVPPVQFWRTGFAQLPNALYATTAGRTVSIAAEMRSNRETQVFFVFPAVAGRRFVNDANFILIDRSGVYSGLATMRLEIYDYAGILQHVVSADSVDLQTAPLHVWTKLALSSAVGDRLLEPGEFLAFRFALDGASSGNLDVHPAFEVTVGPLQIFLPLVRR
jgi:hypothetical protein